MKAIASRVASLRTFLSMDKLFRDATAEELAGVGEVCSICRYVPLSRYVLLSLHISSLYLSVRPSILLRPSISLYFVLLSSLKTFLSMEKLFRDATAEELAGVGEVCSICRCVSNILIPSLYLPVRPYVHLSAGECPTHLLRPFICRCVPLSIYMSSL